MSEEIEFVVLILSVAVGIVVGGFLAMRRLKKDLEDLDL